MRKWGWGDGGMGRWGAGEAGEEIPPCLFVSLSPTPRLPHSSTPPLPPSSTPPIPQPTQRKAYLSAKIYQPEVASFGLHKSSFKLMPSNRDFSSRCYKMR